MKRLFLLFCIGLSIAGCSRQQRYTPITIPDTVSLQGVVLCDSVLTQVTVGQCVVGDYLVVAYPDRNKNLCHLYTKAGDHVADFCPVGKGPGEAIVLTSVYPEPDSVSFITYESQAKKRIRWHIDSLLSGSRKPAAEISTPSIPMFAQVVLNSAAGMLAIGNSGIISPDRTERLFLFDRNDRLLSRYGVYPESDDTIRMKSAYRQHYETVSPDGTKMAFGIYFGAILETFDVKDSIRLRNISYFIEPDFPHDAVGNPTSYDDMTFGFGPLCSSDEYIYAAYNGTKDYQKMHHIAVFDWDGRLQKFYRTAFHLIRTAYDPEANAIFALVKDQGEYRLVRFDLPDTSI